MLLFLLLICTQQNAPAQNNALILNGAFIPISNGTLANPVYLVVNGGQPAAIQRNSGAIISEKEGNFIQWNTADITVSSSFVFPFGYGTTDYLPVSIHKNPVGAGPSHVNNASPIIISTWATAADNTMWATVVTSMNGPSGANATNSVIDRWWQLQGGTNVNATADLSYRGAENTTAVPFALFNAQEWDIPGGQFISAAGSGSGVTSGTGSVTGITFSAQGTGISSPFILSSVSSPLPVELISFTAACSGNTIGIHWSTATETNVRDIELQKSTDMYTWNTVYTAAPSNTSHTANYEFAEAALSGGIEYYRLVTNNNDGGNDISMIISAQPCNSESYLLNAFVYSGSLNIHSVFSSATALQYALFDMQGKKVLSGEFIAPDNEQTLSIPLGALPDAIYIFSARSAERSYNQKLIFAQ